MPRTLDQIADDMFELRSIRGTAEDLALRSLSLALRAYCSSCAAWVWRPIILDDAIDQETEDLHTPASYWDCAFETIIHLQHFCELVVKQALRESHWLLTVEPVADVELLDQLAHQSAPASPPESLQTATAGKCLERASKLLRKNRLPPHFNFIGQHRQFLEKLNTLRNRLWHRGAHILRYNALDDLVGAYALPFIAEVEKLARYSGRGGIWKPPAHVHGLDVLGEIQREYQNAAPDAERVAYLKEIGRASYASPLFLDGGRQLAELFERDNRSHRNRASAAAQHLAERGKITKVAKCPVCDAQSLCLHEEEYEGQPVVYQVECLCCTFRVGSGLGNPSDHGLRFHTWFQPAV